MHVGAGVVVVVAVLVVEVLSDLVLRPVWNAIDGLMSRMRDALGTWGARQVRWQRWVLGGAIMGFVAGAPGHGVIALCVGLGLVVGPVVLGRVPNQWVRKAAQAWSERGPPRWLSIGFTLGMLWLLAQHACRAAGDGCCGAGRISASRYQVRQNRPRSVGLLDGATGQTGSPTTWRSSWPSCKPTLVRRSKPSSLR